MFSSFAPLRGTRPTCLTLRQIAFGPCLVLLIWLSPAWASGVLPSEPPIWPDFIRLAKVEGDGVSFTKIGSDAGLSQTRATQIAQDNRGFLWFSTQYGLNRYDGYKFRHFRRDAKMQETLSGTNVYALFIDERGVLWVGRYNSLDRSEGRQGLLWLASGNGFCRLNPSSGALHYQHAQADPASLSSDSVKSTMEDSDGDLWVATSEGVDRFDTDSRRVLRLLRLNTGTGECLSSTQPGRNSQLKTTPGHADNLVLRHDQNAIALEFAALSYRGPATNRYRHMLSGLDSSWQLESSHRRFVRYAALAPGEYVFQVQGAAAGGPWSGPGTRIRVQVLPPWWGTWWLTTLIIVAVGLTAGAAYVLRMKSLAWQMTIRMEERLDERTRIARDIHDTLLQGLLSASLQLSIANSQVPPQTKGKPLLLRVSELLHQMIDESRNTVRGLRVRHLAALEDAIAQIPRNLNFNEHPEIAIHVNGTRRTLRQHVRDEVYWIARESIANSTRHAKASSIEVEIDYSPKRFRLLVHDNGCGIPEDVINGGRSDHWGLAGMSERAQRIRGHFVITSQVGNGTEVDLCVPAEVAFEALSLT